jgi:uncharacterized protein (TIGR03435 family)
MLKHSFRDLALGLLAATGLAFGQAAAPLSFEVASIKPAGPLDPVAMASGKAHIGTSIDKARVDIGGTPLIGLICTAYKLKPYQISGAQPWMYTERYDIVAKMPPGANQDQVPEMLQSLLAERFKLTIHHDNRDTSVYAMVEGKGGHKMKEAPPDPAEPPKTDAATGPNEGESKPPAAAKGEMVFGSGDNQVRMKQSDKGMTMSSKETGPMKITMESGIIHMEGEKMSMEMLTAMLSQYLDRPVVDQTGLKGKYQMKIDIAMADAMRMAAKMGVNVPPGGPGGGGAATGGGADSGPSASDPSGSTLFGSVQQLGLKLEPKKLPYDYLVIDHIEKTPTEN